MRSLDRVYCRGKLAEHRAKAGLATLQRRRIAVPAKAKHVAQRGAAAPIVTHLQPRVAAVHRKDCVRARLPGGPTIRPDGNELVYSGKEVSVLPRGRNLCTYSHGSGLRAAPRQRTTRPHCGA